MKNEFLISIIVPVYNVEEYIKECIDSLKNQTYHNYEVIIVDDGSKDNSITIAKSIINGDGRFKIYSKENGGLSSARNYGLRKASGEYVMFLDSDDWLDYNCLESLSQKAKDFDIVCFDYVAEDGNTSAIIKQKYYKDASDFDNYVLGQPSACTKIYRLEIFLKNGVQFDEGIHYEDLALIPSLVKYASKVAFLNIPYYHYRIRNNSIMHKTSFSNKVDDKFVALTLLKERLGQEYLEEYEFIVIKQLFFVYLFEIIKYSSKIYKPRISRVIEYFNMNCCFQNNKYFTEESLINKIFFRMVRKKRYLVLKLIYLLKIKN